MHQLNGGIQRRMDLMAPSEAENNKVGRIVSNRLVRGHVYARRR